MSRPAIAHAQPIPQPSGKAAASGWIGPTLAHGDFFEPPRLRRQGLPGSAGNPCAALHETSCSWLQTSRTPKA